MKKIMILLTSVMMAAALAACTPTTDKNQKRTPPAGADQQTTVDGAAEKAADVSVAPTVTVCVYTVKEDKSGLKQNMDAIDGSELDAQLLIDKMAEFGVLEAGIEVLKFEQKDSTLTLDLSGLEKADDKQIRIAIANTFLQNYEAIDGELILTVNGKRVGDKNLTYDKQYKTAK